MNNTTPPKYVDIIEEEFGKALGAKPTTYSEKLTIFIAHKDRDGNLLEEKEIEQWVTKAESVLSKVGGGATSVLVRGAWVEDGATTPIHEPTTLVYTYAAPSSIENMVQAIRDFAIDYGKSTNQSIVAILLENNDGDWFFRIDVKEH